MVHIMDMEYKNEKSMILPAIGKVRSKDAVFRRQRAVRVVSVITLAVGSLLLWHPGFWRQWHTLEPIQISQSSENFSWMDISPTKDIVWHPCYEKFDCARLDVPLDWQDPSDDLRASIAMIKFNATDREDYKGPVFINPGGPGGSGVWFVKKLADHYQTVVGRNHDIIGFDPRGIGMTRPLIDCWNGYQQNAQLWALQDVPVLDAHPGILYDAYAQAAALSHQCASAIGEGSHRADIDDPVARKVQEAGPGRFVSTAYVARDLVEMMEKVGEKKLKFWGFSYGTVIATTFSSMFPDKVGRIVSDGNVDVRGWYSISSTHFIDDAPKVMSAFYHFCHLAGPSQCQFYAKTPEAIEKRLDKLLEDLKRHPVIVPAHESSRNRPAIVSFSSVRRFIAASFYRPLSTFPKLAEALADLEVGDGRPFMKASGGGNEEPISCEVGSNEKLGEGTADAFLGVMCSEGSPINETADEFQTYVDTLVNLSSATGAVMAQNFRLKCVQWSVRTKWRYDGPFEANPAYPVLFIANYADNVTPLRSARMNSKSLNGSRILIQNSYGHTSLSTPSKCTVAVINSYFQNGTLPEHERVCEPDLVPFERFDVKSMSQDGLDFALHRLMEAPIPGML